MDPRMSVEVTKTVPCPMCCNSQTSGQLDQPREGWPRNEFPEHIMSVPCPMCAAVGTIPQDEWDKMCRPNAEPVPENKTEKKKEKSLMPAFWTVMKDHKKQQEEEWFKQGPFLFREVD